jgi:hypothetical protein
MSKSVLIPVSYLQRIIELLEHLDVSYYDLFIQLEYIDALKFLQGKKSRLELRDKYANIILADNEAVRHDARISYLQHKAQLRLDDSDSFL